MKTLDQHKWVEKTSRLNKGVMLVVGMRVKDVLGTSGVVMDIEIWEGQLTIENHGSITVFKGDVSDCSEDNCEHYSFYGWQSVLRIL